MRRAGGLPTTPSGAPADVAFVPNNSCVILPACGKRGGCDVCAQWLFAVAVFVKRYIDAQTTGRASPVVAVFQPFTTEFEVVAICFRVVFAVAAVCLADVVWWTGNNKVSNAAFERAT